MHMLQTCTECHEWQTGSPGERFIRTRSPGYIGRCEDICSSSSAFLAIALGFGAAKTVLISQTTGAELISPLLAHSHAWGMHSAIFCVKPHVCTPTWTRTVSSSYRVLTRLRTALGKSSILQSRCKSQSTQRFQSYRCYAFAAVASPERSTAQVQQVSTQRCRYWSRLASL